MFQIKKDSHRTMVRKTKPRGEMVPNFEGKKLQNNEKRSKYAELGAMSVDDFMRSGLEGSGDSEDDCEVNETQFSGNGSSLNAEDSGGSSDESALEDDIENNKVTNYLSRPEGDNQEMSMDSGDSDDDTSTDDDKEDEDNWTSANFSHKKAVGKLQETDPEFFKFLQENDKDLLNFDESDSDTDNEAGGKIHTLPDKLEIASDESDFEEENVEKNSRAITLKMVKEWEVQLRTNSSQSCEPINQVMLAFQAAAARVSNDDQDDLSLQYVVTGSAVFNAVLQLCVLDLQPALKKYLKIPRGKHVDPKKNKAQWQKVKRGIRSYLTSLVKLLGRVSSSHILAVMLKHLHQMMPFVGAFLFLHRSLLKILVLHWSTNEDTVRIVAFLCILRLTTHKECKILDHVLKRMYLAYIRNSKFVSPSTLPAINFMRKSLVEMFALDLNVTYQHAFLYIRQLAIHLRNAITIHKKETNQAVYNWQYINSLHLWTDLIGATASKPHLQQLLYPIVQVILGTIKLIPSAQHFPLRFHCTKMLIELSKRTCTYIPILPFLLEVLNTYDFNKRNKKVSMKPMTFTFILRVTNPQMEENGFKDVILDTIYNQMLEYLSNESSTISFPDLVIPTVIQLKKFLKTCGVSSYCRKIKQLHDKIMENAGMIEKERQKVNFKLTDEKAIAAWETQLKLRGTPLSRFYESWSKIHAQQAAKKLTQNDEIGDFKLPELKKRPREDKPESNGPVVLFPSDDSDSDIDLLKSENNSEESKPKKKKRKPATITEKESSEKPKVWEAKDDFDDEGDIVEDLNLEDLM